MPNGRLDKFLYDRTIPTLNWAQRFRLINGVSSGLLCLHEDCEKVVIHRDIKASNVLLDGEFKGCLEISALNDYMIVGLILKPCMLLEPWAI